MEDDTMANERFIKATDEQPKPETAKELPPNVKDMTPSPSKDKKKIFAIDIGYGYVKVVCDEKEFHFPSYVARCTKDSIHWSDFENNRKYDLTKNLIIEDDNGETYAVGDLACSILSDVKRATFRDRKLDDTFGILFRAALALAYDGQSDIEVYVSTGVPNSLAKKQADALKQMIEETKKVTYHTPYGKKVISIDCPWINIMTQPQGFAVDIMVEDDLKYTDLYKEYNDTEIGVIDIGHYTTDFSIFKGLDLIDLGGVSNSTEGFVAVHTLIRAALVERYKKFGYEPFDSDIDNAILKGKIELRGKKEDVTDIVEEATKRYANGLAAEIINAWEKNLNRLGLMFVEGGGAISVTRHFSQALQAKYQHDGLQRVSNITDAQMMDARGFYKAAKMKLS